MLDLHLGLPTTALSARILQRLSYARNAWLQLPYGRGNDGFVRPPVMRAVCAEAVTGSETLWSRFLVTPFTVDSKDRKRLWSALDSGGSQDNWNTGGRKGRKGKNKGKGKGKAQQGKLKSRTPDGR